MLGINEGVVLKSFEGRFINAKFCKRNLIVVKIDENA